MDISDANLKALTAFAGAAGAFCTFIESLRQGRPKNMYSSMERLLAQLHFAILPVEKELPSKEHPDFERIEASNDEKAAINRAIGEVTAEETATLVNWHRSLQSDDAQQDSDDTVRAGMFWMDLAELYHDVQYGLRLWNSGLPEAQAEAAWQWRFLYEAHWGEHLFRATQTVHEARYNMVAD